MSSNPFSLWQARKRRKEGRKERTQFPLTPPAGWVLFLSLHIYNASPWISSNLSWEVPLASSLKLQTQLFGWLWVLGSMVVASSSNLVGTFDQLSRASMTMHDKANFTIAPIIYLFLKIEKNYLNWKKLRKKKKKTPHSIVPYASLQVELLQVCTPSSIISKKVHYLLWNTKEGRNEWMKNCVIPQALNPQTLSPQKCIDNFFQCLAFLITQCICHPQLKSPGKSSQRFFILFYFN